jgi:hypothetical protein
MRKPRKLGLTLMCTTYEKTGVADVDDVGLIIAQSDAAGGL